MLETIRRTIDAISDGTGRLLSFALPIMTITTIAIIVFAQFFNSGWVWMNEIIVYLHGLLFMLATSYTLLHEGHVRVDVIYANCSPKKQAWINILGVIFLLVPTCLVIFIYSYSYVLNSWNVLETSSEGQGLPIVYLLKTSILIMPCLLILQGISMIIKNWQVIQNKA